MANSKSKVYGGQLAGFKALCIAAGVALIACKIAGDFDASAPTPEPTATQYVATIKSEASLDMKSMTELKIGAASIGLGEAGTFSFAADAQGSAKLPISLNLARKATGSQAVWLAHSEPYNQVLWGRDSIVLRGLRPHGKYEAEAALWFKGPGRKGELEKSFVYTNAKDLKVCANQCLIALGAPALIGVEGFSPSAVAQNVGLAVAGTWPRMFASWAALGAAVLLASRGAAVLSAASAAAGFPRSALRTRAPRLGAR